MHVRSSFAVLVGLVFAHAPALRAEPAVVARSAQRGSVTLSVKDEPACVGAEDLLERVAAEVPLDDVVPVAIEVSGRAHEVAFVITTRDGQATRRFVFDDAGCDARMRVLTLALALALESLVVEDAPPPNPAVPPVIVAPPPTAPRPVADAAAREPTTPAGSRTPTWSLAVAALAVFGALPIPGAGGELQPRLSGRRWSARLGLGVFTSPRVLLGVGRFRASSFTVVPDGCGLLPAGAAAVRLCAGVELGMLWARGHDYRQPRNTTTPHVAPRVAFELAAPVAPRVSLLLGAAVAVPVVRVRFVAGELTTSGWPVIVRATAGVAVDLGPRRRPGGVRAGR